MSERKAKTSFNIGETYEFNRIKHGFIKPLMEYIRLAADRHHSAGRDATERTNTPTTDMLDIIFGTKYREITPANTTSAFAMPGLMWGSAGLVDAKKPSKEQAHIKKGSCLFVRIDERTPDRIDVELCTIPEKMFTLTNEEYKQIRPYLKEIEGCNKQALEPPSFMR